MAAAPEPLSSAGCPTKTRVPFHEPRLLESSVAAATQALMWTSWPQACITGTGFPASSFPVALLA
jgi:hypothetical protein